MSAFFLTIVNMSISAGWLVLAVLLLRLILKKAPKWVSVLLWGFVAVRLICPFSIESILSLIPSAETISPGIMMDPTPQIHTGIGPLNSVINPIVSESFTPAPGASMNPLQVWIPLAAVVWIIGITVMLIYTAVSYILLRRRVAAAVLLRDNIYQSENVDSPFVLGVIVPKIYLPFQMASQDMEHVIAHEVSHIRRNDHWWKPFGFLLLTIHWFNPLMWLGYILLCRDIELACDEKVIKEMDNENRADYTQALVSCSVNRRSIAACPLAFGEIGVKERVKSVMNYKKPAFWIILASIIACAIVAVCFLTNPKEQPPLPNIHDKTYAVEEITYEGGVFGFSMRASDHLPFFKIDENRNLFSQKVLTKDGVWTQLGKLEELDLNVWNFDMLFFDHGDWEGEASAGSIRKNTAKAWHLTYKQEFLCYVLQQKNGDIYLAYGYHNMGVGDVLYTRIRWLFKLAEGAPDTSALTARSGDSAVPLLSFPAQTAIADIAASVQWLEVDSIEDWQDPFSFWRGDEEIVGTYCIYDATMRPVDKIGLFDHSAFSYIIQEPNPIRRFVVTVSLPSDSDTEIYAFGFAYDGTMTLEDVLALAEKTEDLTFGDFSGFVGKVGMGGSGAIMGEYYIDSNFRLSLRSDPFVHARLHCDACARSINIQKGDVKAFIEAHSHSVADSAVPDRNAE